MSEESSARAPRVCLWGALCGRDGHIPITSCAPRNPQEGGGTWCGTDIRARRLVTGDAPSTPSEVVAGGDSGKALLAQHTVPAFWGPLSARELLQILLLAHGGKTHEGVQLL